MTGLRHAGGETPGHRWEAVFAAPDPRLRAHVIGDYQGFHEWSAVPVDRPQLPVVMVPVIFNLGPFWEIGAPDVPWGQPRTFDSFLAGLHDGIATTRSGGDSACLQVNLTPLAAHLLLRCPMSDLANRTLNLGDLLGPDGRDLIQRLREATDWPERFRMLDAFLLARLGNGVVAGDTAFALRRLAASHGRLAIGAIADDLSISRKRLIARFQHDIGLAPKTVARLYRFNRMLTLLARPQQRGLAELAGIAGYYDQAHFNRDFRDFARVTPGEYLATLPDRPAAH